MPRSVIYRINSATKRSSDLNHEALLDPPAVTASKPATLSEMNVTKHARARFAQRFATLDMEEEWLHAKRCGKQAVKRILLEQRKKRGGKRRGGRPPMNCVYYQGPGGPVFVVVPSSMSNGKEVIVTVLPDFRYSMSNDIQV